MLSFLNYIKLEEDTKGEIEHRIDKTFPNHVRSHAGFIIPNGKVHWSSHTAPGIHGKLAPTHGFKRGQDGEQQAHNAGFVRYRKDENGHTHIQIDGLNKKSVHHAIAAAYMLHTPGKKIFGDVWQGKKANLDKHTSFEADSPHHAEKLFHKGAKVTNWRQRNEPEDPWADHTPEPVWEHISEAITQHYRWLVHPKKGPIVVRSRTDENGQRRPIHWEIAKKHKLETHGSAFDNLERGTATLEPHPTTPGKKRLTVYSYGKSGREHPAPYDMMQHLKTKHPNAEIRDYNTGQIHEAFSSSNDAERKGWMSPNGTPHYFQPTNHHATEQHPDIEDQVHRQMKKVPKDHEERETIAQGLAQKHGYTRYGTGQRNDHFIHFDHEARGSIQSALHALRDLNPKHGSRITVEHKPWLPWKPGMKFSDNSKVCHSPSEAAAHIRSFQKTKD